MYKQSRPLAVRRKTCGYCVLTGRILTNEALMYFHFCSKNIYELRCLNRLFSSRVLELQDRGRELVTLLTLENSYDPSCAGWVGDNSSRSSLNRYQLANVITDCGFSA